MQQDIPLEDVVGRDGMTVALDPLVRTDDQHVDRQAGQGILVQETRGDLPFGHTGLEVSRDLGENPIRRPANPAASLDIQVGERVVEIDDLCAILTGTRQREIGADLHPFHQLQHLVLGRALVPVQGDELVPLLRHVLVDKPLPVHPLRNQPLVISRDHEVRETHLAGRDDAAIAARRDPGETVLAAKYQSVKPLSLEKGAHALPLDLDVSQNLLRIANLFHEFPSSQRGIRNRVFEAPQAKYARPQVLFRCQGGPLYEKPGFLTPT